MPATTPLRTLAGAVLAAALMLSAPSSADASMAQPRIASETPGATPHAINDSVVANAAVHTFSQVGSVMYAGGKFHTVQDPAMTTSYTRDNLFSFDVTTGQPTAWSPAINGQVFRTLYVAPYLYVGGYFTSANGVSGHLVRYNVSGSTPTIDSSWRAPSITGNVTDLEYVNGRLIVAGTFSKQLVALDPSTGKDTGYIDLGIAGRVADKAGPTSVYRFAVNPAGTKLVAVGNFTAVGGQTHYRAFMADLGSASATLSSWNYAPLQNMCRAQSLPAYLRDVDFSSDGTYFVIVSTGWVPADKARIGTDLCDAAARFEANTMNPKQPTWINYTGGDTLHSVAAVDSVVYVGGHQRWLDNPQGVDYAGTGAVSRPGVGALDPSTGKALAWNPTKTRGVGVKFIYPTASGVWFGSDGRKFNRKVHDSIAYTPLS